MAIADVAARYAPLVVLHGDDKLRPSSADWFVERSGLRWATGRGLDGEQVQETGLDPTRLGAASGNPYRHGDYAASARTRPLDNHAGRGDRPPVEQGFFLRLREESSARGDKGTSSDPAVYAGATTYWDYEEDVRALTFWLFYPGSSPPLGILRAGEQIGTRGPPTEAVPTELEAADAAAKLEEFRRAYPELADQAETETVPTRGISDVIEKLKVVAEGVRALLRADDVLHEGDWERITLYLDEADPEGAPPASVGFYRHSTNTFKKWSTIEKEGDRPVVYCAIGSHASLPDPDFGQIDVGDRDGPRWRTWEELAPIAEQPWYGFGGAWGRLGRVRDATGPLGPGAHWKHAAPRPRAQS
jgi:hypothetical protein